MNVSVIVPVLNERDTIGPLVQALLHQTVEPNEVVVADGGSTDGTRQVLTRLAEDDPRVRVVDGPGGISENRNAAIRAARSEIIACTDAGCVPERDWLEQLTAPFAQGAAWVAGFYRPVGNTTASTAAGLVIMAVREEVGEGDFIPGGASQAFLKTAWERVGGFPEGMAAGEDTLFGRRMLAAGLRPVFRPEAVVSWSPPPGIGAMARKVFLWGREDARAGMPRANTTPLMLGYLSALLLPVALWFRKKSAVPGALLPLAALVGYRTRHKYRWAEGPSKWILIPLAHLVQIFSQSLGWWSGHLASTERPSMRALAARRARWLAVWAKRLIRPFVPEAVMVRLRRPDLGASTRVNVDIVVSDRAEAEAWVRSTPDTYRAVVASPEEVETPAAVVTADHGLTPSERARLLTPLASPDVDVSILGETRPPKIDRNRVTEPEVAVVAAAARKEREDEVAAPDPEVVYDRARHAGLHLALTPLTPSGRTPGRRDPIDGIGSVVVLGAVPLHDVGGGSRGAQITQELLGRGYHVVHAYRFDAAESVDLGLRYLHPRLEHRRFDQFDLERHLERLATDRRLVIAEMPHPDFPPVIERLRDGGYRVVYDLIDDWSDPALGGWGFQPAAEETVIMMADALVGSAPSLVKRLERISNRRATEVPNAVNIRLFAPGPHDPPADFPAGEGPVFEYHGSLYGDWFDWNALGAVAEAYPAARVVVIGDDRNRPPMPGNVSFLGLKPQHRLPSYLAHTDVALIPFVVSETTHAVSPLKVFEYLAMGVPVAAAPLQPLLGLDGVFTDHDLVKAVAAALAGPTPDPEPARKAHGWGDRIDRLFAAAGMEALDDPEVGPVKVVERPSIRYPAAERLVLR